jgi:hypothetical protein
MHTDNGFAPLSYMCAFDFRTSPTGDVFFESDIWQVKVRSDCAIICAENI